MQAHVLTQHLFTTVSFSLEVTGTVSIAVTQYCARINLYSGLQLFITEKFRNISTRAELIEIYLLLSIFKHTMYAQI